jgi:hypothetical protein
MIGRCPRPCYCQTEHPGREGSVALLLDIPAANDAAFSLRRDPFLVGKGGAHTFFHTVGFVRCSSICRPAPPPVSSRAKNPLGLSLTIVHGPLIALEVHGGDGHYIMHVGLGNTENAASVCQASPFPCNRWGRPISFIAYLLSFGRQAYHAA